MEDIFPNLKYPLHPHLEGTFGFKMSIWEESPPLAAIYREMWEKSLNKCHKRITCFVLWLKVHLLVERDKCQKMSHTNEGSRNVNSKELMQQGPTERWLKSGKHIGWKRVAPDLAAGCGRQQSESKHLKHVGDTVVVMPSLAHWKLFPHANGDVEPTKTGDGVASLDICKARRPLNGTERSLWVGRMLQVRKIQVRMKASHWFYVGLFLPRGQCVLG